MNNRNGVDANYFAGKLALVVAGIDRYTAQELARELARLAKTADADAASGEFPHPAPSQPARAAMPNDQPVDSWQVGCLLTMSDSSYPGMGSMFAQIWQGDDLIARVYGDSYEEVQSRAARIAVQPVATVPEWISVDDRLPEDDVEVLINGSEGVEIARYMLAEDDCPDSMGHDAGWCGYKFAIPGRSFGAESYMCQAQGQPTHWMPLPQPPAAQPQDDGAAA